MQRRQQSLLSFFNNGAKSSQKELSDEDRDSLSHYTSFPLRSNSSSFDALKHKILRPQRPSSSSPQGHEAFHSFCSSNPSQTTQQGTAFFSADVSLSKQQHESCHGVSPANTSHSKHALPQRAEAFHRFAPALQNELLRQEDAPNCIHPFSKQEQAPYSIQPYSKQAPPQQNGGFHGFSSTSASQSKFQQTGPSQDSIHPLSTKVRSQHNEGSHGSSPANASPTHTKDTLKLLQKTVQAADERLRCFGPSYAIDSSIPGIKRIREDHDGCLSDDSRLFKRKLLMEALGEGEEQKGLWEEAKAKFDWLNPSKVRDSKGRKLGDQLYDKRTLQIPSDALNKMSASQKQYWVVKSQYMDTILFFKVGKFYELYELDAEIGHKELNWKMTVSGVGKCRQVDEKASWKSCYCIASMWRQTAHIQSLGKKINGYGSRSLFIMLQQWQLQ